MKTLYTGIAVALLTAFACSAEIRVTPIHYAAPPPGMERFPFTPAVMILIDDDGKEAVEYLVILKHRDGQEWMWVPRGKGTSIALFPGRYEDPKAAVRAVSKPFAVDDTKGKF